MKIGVDVRLLSRPLTGIGRYTYEMCLALSKISNISLYLYSPAPIIFQAKNKLAADCIRTKNWNNGLLRQLWAEFYLPVWIKNDAIDIFWSPMPRLPRYLPASIPKVITVHDLVWKHEGGTMHPRTRLIEKFGSPFAVRNADKIIVDSLSTAEALKEEYSNESLDPVIVHPGTTLIKEDHSFDLLQKYGVFQDYFLFVGTLEPRKNLNRLLLAYAKLPLTIKRKAKLIIVGGKGWGNVDLEQTIKELNIVEHIKLLGYVNDQMLATLYANALFLAMPSLYEGFGLPLIEAMAHGTPVLTANNSSMPEVAGDAGLLIDAEDVLSIVNGLTQLINNEGLRRKLAMRTKSNAARFNWDTSAKSLYTLFDQVIEASKQKVIEQDGL